MQMNVHTEREFMREIPTKAIAIPILLLFRWEFKRVDTHTHTTKHNAIIVHNDIGLEAITGS